MGPVDPGRGRATGGGSDGAEWGSTALHRVYERRGGVPLFVEELTRLSDDDDMLPDAVRDVALAHYERLHQATRRVLRLITAGAGAAAADVLG